MPKENIEPNYYGDPKNKNDVINFCRVHNVGFLEGNVIKYVFRYKGKNGLQDLIKARTYLDRLIEYEEKQDKKV